MYIDLPEKRCIPVEFVISIGRPLCRGVMFESPMDEIVLFL